MTETKTKIHDVFVDISSLLFVRQLMQLIVKMHVLTAQPTAVRRPTRSPEVGLNVNGNAKVVTNDCFY